MLQIVVNIDGADDDPQGVKEKLAMDLERFGDVRVVSVERKGSEQIRLEG